MKAKIIEIWEKNLQIENGHDFDSNYFELGGSSLTIIKLLNEIKRETGINIQISDFFQNPTLNFILTKEVKKDVFEESIFMEESILEYEVSPAQELILFNMMNGKITTEYNITQLFKIEGTIDIQRLHSSLNQVFKTVDILSNNFKIEKDKFIQFHVDRELDFEYFYGPIKNLKPKIFDIERDCLMNIKFIEKDEGNFLFFDIHHLIFDGTSLPIFIEKVNHVYNGNGDVTQNKYGVYVKKINAMRSGDKFKQKVALNLDELMVYSSKGFQKLSFEKTIDSGYVSHQFSMKAKLAYRKLKTSLRVSDYCLSSSIFGLAFSLFNQTDTFIYNTPVVNRIHNFFESAIGNFVNTSLVGFKVDILEENIKDITMRVLSEIGRSIENQDIYIQDYLELDKEFREKLPEILFLCETQNQKIEIGNTVLIPENNIFIQEKTGITFRFVNNNEMKLDCNFKKSDYLEKSIVAFFELFERIITEAASKMNQNISEYSLISKEVSLEKIQEKKQISQKKELITYQNFVHNCSKYSKKPAISFNEKDFKYEDIQAEVDKIARYINHHLNCSSRTPIAVCMEPSEKLVIVLLSLMKIALPIVAIDTQYSVDKINKIIESNNISTCIVDDDNSGILSLKEFNVDKIDLSETKDEVQESVSVTKKDVVTIIYTSGTTGDSKAIPFSYDNFSELANNLDYLSISSDARVLQVSNLTFDVFFAALVIWLKKGNNLVLVDKNLVNNPKELALLCRNNYISECFIPTGIFNSFTEKDFINLQDVRLFIAGEEINRVKAREALENGATGIFNFYGPAEASVYVAGKQLTSEDLNEKYIPIGEEFNTVSLQVVNKFGQLLPAFIEGELLVVGDCVSTGYLYEVENIDKKFNLIKYDFTNSYLTGDIGYYDEKNVFHYMHRESREIKVRGRRVNTETIKEAIMELSDLISDVKFAYKENILYAIIQTNRLNNLDSNNIVKKLRNVLPDFMIPSTYYFVEKIPLTVNGKTDIDKILNHTSEELNVFESKESGTLNCKWEKMNSIWNEVLDTDVEYASHSDFYANGGHSLLLLKLVSAIEREFQLVIPTHEIANCSLFQEQIELIKQQPTDESHQSEFEFGKQYPLSPIQESLYINWIESPLSLKNNIAMTVKWNKVGFPDLGKKIQKALESIPILHTSFNADASGLSQKVDRLKKLPIVGYSVKNYDELIALSKPFHLHNDSLVRILDVTVEEENNAAYLFIEFHHIVIDGQSIKNIVDSIISDKENKETLNYFDYINELTSYKETANYQEDLDYWKSVQGIDKSTSILPSLAIKEYSLDGSNNQNDIIYRHFKGENYNKIEDLSKYYEVPPFILFLSSISISLGILTDSNDVTLGTSIGLRRNQYYQKSIGPFIQTVPLRFRDIFKENLKETIQQMFKTYNLGLAHSTIGFPKIVDIAQSAATDFGNPLFDIMFVNQPKELSRQEKFDEYVLTKQELLATEERFGLSIHLLNMEEEFILRVTYDESRYHRQDISTFIESCSAILLNLDKQEFSELNILANKMESGENYLIGDNEKLPESTILDFWENNVLKEPNRICVSNVTTQLSFKEVDVIAEYYAKKILTHVNPKQPVGILFNRSIEMYIAIISILKAGCYYVPIESKETNDYLVRFIQEQELELILTENKYDELKDLTRTVIVVDHLQDKKLTEKNTKRTIFSLPNDIVARLCSSGTTGNPKGIQITNKNLINLAGANPGNRIEKNNALLLVANYTFDISAATLFNAIIHGCKLYIMNDEEIMNPARYHQIINKEVIDYVFLPTAIFHLISFDTFKKMDHQVIFISGGENLSIELVNKLISLKHIRVFNMYGPTETTVYSTIYECTNQLEIEVPIGKPVRNTQIAILNSYHIPVPKGRIGRLFISGEGVSKGYNQMPELTNEKFIEIKGQIFYDTGDLAKIDETGTIIFKGREDNQIKISGHRVEISDLENTLRMLANYQDIHVLFIDERLVAFTDKKESIVAIQNNARGYIESYKMPTKFILLDFIPLTSRGKISKGLLIKEFYKELNEPFDVKNSQITGEVEKIAKIWRAILSDDLNELSLESDFFQIGGTSIQAIMLLSEMQKMNPTLTFQNIIENSLLAKMSTLLLKNLSKEESLDVESTGIENEVIVVLPPYMEQTIYENSFKKVVQNIDSSKTYIFKHICEEDYLNRYFEDIVTIYERHKKPITLMGYSFGGVIAHELNLLMIEANIPIQRIIMLDCYFSIDNKYYSKMLKGTFVSKQVAIYFLEKEYPNLKNVSRKIKLELISNFKKFYEITNKITSSKVISQTKLVFIRLDKSITHIEDTRHIWELYYPNIEIKFYGGEHNKLFTTAELENTEIMIRSLFRKYDKERLI
ncbi:AMP-binding protein [Carnobacterium divergens]|uniref:AMP-binding protein n=1 Tax=Carnobacterium divergens TaxID=2748 RepID=UPI00288CC045|nr:AMP-binding protein [Carnobacterium divergens]MDT2010939.1 AMP-binding protein [Carnobacterium divergens]